MFFSYLIATGYCRKRGNGPCWEIKIRINGWGGRPVWWGENIIEITEIRWKYVTHDTAGIKLNAPGYVNFMSTYFETLQLLTSNFHTVGVCDYMFYGRTLSRLPDKSIIEANQKTGVAPDTQDIYFLIFLINKCRW